MWRGLIVVGLVLVLAMQTHARTTEEPQQSIQPGQRVTSTPTATATQTPTGGPAYLPLVVRALPTSTPTATRNPEQCAAEYPTVCIPPPPPDLNCPDIEFDNFTVLPPDRHKFDTDNDGIGCERN